MTRRIVSLLLAVLLAAGLCLPAYAEAAPEGPAEEAAPAPAVSVDIQADEADTAAPLDEPDTQDTLPGELEPVEQPEPAVEISPEETPPASVTNGSCGANVTWQLVGSALTITGTGDMFDYPGIGSWAPWYGRPVASVTIGSGVTSVGRNAFYECASLRTISISGTVTHIGAGAFEGCASLQSLTLPAQLTDIGARAFYQCSSIASVALPNTVTSLGNDAFAFCTGLRSLTLSSGLETVSLRAFAGCAALQSVTIPNSVTKINGSAFDGCASLASVTLPSRLATLGSSAFQGCASLKSVTIPASLAEVGDWAFADCTSLAAVTFAGGNTRMGIQSFSNTPWAKSQGDFLIVNGTLVQYQGRGGSVTIPSTVRTIGGYAFADCSALTGVTIPSSVTSIGESAFANTGLTEAVIPNSVTSVGDLAFCNIPSMKSLRVAGSVRTIGRDAFWACSGLTSVYIANGVATLGESAFSECSALAELTLPPSVTNIGAHALPAEGSLRRVTILGRSCVIGDNTLPAGTVVSGYNGSTAQTFAQNGGYSFVIYTGPEIPAEPTTPTTPPDPMTTNEWVQQNGKWYYYVNGEPVRSTWLMSARGIWYYMDADGVMVTGVNYVPASRGNYNERIGAYETGTVWPGGWYYFETPADSDAQGRVRGGWHTTQFGRTLSESSHNGRYGMVTYTEQYGYGQPPVQAQPGEKSGWVSEGTAWYYYHDGAPLKSTWLMSARGIWYYMDENGVMVTGVHYVPASTGHFSEGTGRFDTTSSWLGGWYYFETPADSDAQGRVRGGEHVTRFGRTVSESSHNGRYGMITYTEMYGSGQPPRDA